MGRKPIVRFVRARLEGDVPVVFADNGLITDAVPVWTYLGDLVVEGYVLQGKAAWGFDLTFTLVDMEVLKLAQHGEETLEEAEELLAAQPDTFLPTTEDFTRLP